MPSGIVLVAGVTAIELSFTLLTVRVAAGARMLPEDAVIVVVPVCSPCASPVVPAELLIVAAAVFDEPQLTAPVKSCVLPSLNVPVALNC